VQNNELRFQLEQKLGEIDLLQKRVQNFQNQEKFSSDQIQEELKAQIKNANKILLEVETKVESLHDEN
jgi:hypothetical protein